MAFCRGPLRVCQQRSIVTLTGFCEAGVRVSDRLCGASIKAGDLRGAPIDSEVDTLILAKQPVELL